jgi:hypothetical protein
MNAVDNRSFHANIFTKPHTPDGSDTSAHPTPITQNDASGWHRYKNSLTKRKIKHYFHRWYVLHVKAFLDCFPGQRLSDLDADTVTTHLQQLESTHFQHDWQLRQYISAIEILLVDTATLTWSKTIEWDQLKRNITSIPIDHPTIARETDGCNPVDPVFAASLNDGHRQSLLALCRELRVRRYAIKTEKNLLSLGSAVSARE